MLYRMLKRLKVRSPDGYLHLPSQGAPTPASSIAFNLRCAFSRFIPKAAQHICACTFAVPKYRARAKLNLRFIVPNACSTLKRIAPIFLLNWLY